MSLILVACLADGPAESTPASEPWTTGTEAPALRALGATISGTGLEDALAQLGDAERGWLSQLDACTDRLDQVERMRDSLLVWPAVDGAQEAGVDPIAVRLRDAGELEVQRAAAEVSAHVAQARVDCAAGVAPSEAGVTSVVAMQRSALTALSEVVRFLPEAELERVAGGDEVRGWLGLAESPTG